MNTFCDCIDRINDLLAEFNTRFVLSFNLFDQNLPPETVVIATQKVNQKIRGKPKMVLPTYCPFCGKLYGKQKEEEVRLGNV